MNATNLAIRNERRRAAYAVKRKAYLKAKKNYPPSNAQYDKGDKLWRAEQKEHGKEEAYKRAKKRLVNHPGGSTNLKYDPLTHKTFGPKPRRR
tara:strand:+ start:57 stop:335 length:279 start_codon:yes stop_codon:yes gene_type:complete